ncbi:hypothetical protein BD311DRAFT_799244 [Dichomitus squalens]|uniref:Uncharacterized protein n=1 Tax=Dichomitus squalens TaxID=114155 RepID=A0A4Q9MFI1_9APHY|nr:hypothetical protein BD311DRAFT_799244 [Dichomitus squalens]
MAPTRKPFTNAQNTVTTATPSRRPRSSNDPSKKKRQAKDAAARTAKKPLKPSSTSPNVPRAREYGVPRHLKNVKSVPQHAPFEPRIAAADIEVVCQAAEAKARAANMGHLDEMQFGREAAALLGPGLERVPGRVVFGDDALRKYSKSAGLNEHVQTDERDVVRYEHPDAWECRQRAKGRPPPLPHTDLELPVVCVNNENAFGIDAMLTGGHGFAWMVTPECAELDRLGPFHLFNNPGPMDSWYIRNWHYCGRYYAHRTGRQMNLDGWQKLPQAIKDAATGINAGAPSGLCVELIILQFCGLPDWTVWGKLHEAAANCVRPAKPPGTPPNRLALPRLFAKHGQELIDEHAHMQSIRLTGRRI